MPSLTRRQVLAATGTTGVALAGCLSIRSSSGDLGQVDGAWSMVGRDAGHTRRVGNGPMNPQTVWTTDLAQARATGTPSVVDESLYLPVDAVTDRARHRYRVQAVAAATGEERWQVPLRAEPNAPLAVHDGHIIATARRTLDQGRIVCMQDQYGEEDWLVDIDARLTAPPTVAGGVVYVPDWRGRVHALAVHDGTVRWARQIGAAGASRTFATPAAVHDGTLYLGSRAGTTGVVAVNATTGDRRWQQATAAVTGGPVVAGGLVVVQTHQLVVAFDTDGTHRWSFNVPGHTGDPLAVDDQHVYVPARDGLHAIRRTGEDAWTYAAPDRHIGTPTVVGDSVVVRVGDHLTALAQATGDEQWTAQPANAGQPVVTPRAVFLAGAEGTVMGLGAD